MSTPNATFFVTGDLVPLHDTVTLLAQGKCEEVFSTVLPEIRSCDLGITNLECAATAGARL